MKSLLVLLISLSCVFATVPTGAEATPLQTSSQIDPGWDSLPTILQRIQPPVFPKRDYRITDYGALQGRATRYTEAFVQAIKTCNVEACDLQEAHLPDSYGDAAGAKRVLLK